MNTPEHILRMFALFGARWPNHPVSPETVLVYSIALSDVPFEDLEIAVVQALRTSKFFPGIDELRELARGPSGTLSPEEGWAEAMRERTRIGLYGIPRFSSEALRRAVESIGWRNLCTMETRDVPANRAHFLRIYGAMADKAEREHEYQGAKELVEGLAGLLGGGPKKLYGKQYTDPPEEQGYKPRPETDEPPQMDDIDP